MATNRSATVYGPSLVVGFNPAYMAAVLDTLDLFGEINVLNYGADPTGVVDSAPAIRLAIARAVQAGAEAGGATVFIPKGDYKINTQIEVPEHVVIAGAGSFATFIHWGGAGYCWKIGTTGVNFAYGCGIANMRILIEATGAPPAGAIWSIGTSGMFMRNLEIEGISTKIHTGIQLDGGAISNLFTTIDNVNVAHVLIGMAVGGIGNHVTSVVASGLNLECDSRVGSKGIVVAAGCGNGSRFFGGNLESIETAIEITGFGCEFFGMRFELTAGVSTSVLLIFGAASNAFIGCIGMDATNPVIDNSGEFSNVFFGNRAYDGSHYPLDTAFLTSLTFGTVPLVRSERIVGPIANNGVATIVGLAAAELVIYDTGVTGEVCRLLISGTTATLKIVSQTGVIFTLVPTTGGRINFSIAGNVLSIENKVGAPTTLRCELLKIA